MIGEEPARRDNLGEFDFDDVEERADQEWQHRPVAFGVANAAVNPAGNAEEEERAEMPDVFFLRHHFADYAGEKADERGGRRGDPLVIAERGQADQRATEQPDDATADEAE